MLLNERLAIFYEESIKSYNSRLLDYISAEAFEIDDNFYRFDLYHLIKNFLSSDKLLCLIQGSVGYGKTYVSQFVACNLWENAGKTGLIPLYIPLTKNATPNLIEDTLKQHGFSIEQINELQQNREFILVLDGVDACLKYQHIYRLLNLAAWRGKVIVTCQPEYFINFPDYYMLFTPVLAGKSRQDLLYVLNLAAYCPEQIKKYLITNPYQQAILSNPQLLQMVTNPLLLRLLVVIIPRFIDKNNQLINIKQICFQLLEEWFSYQAKKLKEQGLWNKNDDALPQKMWSYSHDIAIGLHLENSFKIGYQPKSHLFRTKFSQWDKIFDSKDKNLALLRRASPLNMVEPRTYEFFHNVILDCLRGDLEVKEGKSSPPKIVDNTPIGKSVLDQFVSHPLNQHLITKDLAMIQSLADRVYESESFKAALFKILRSSDKRLSIAIANSLTILVEAKVSIVDIDLSELDTSGADVSGGVLQRVKLNKSKLHNFKFNSTFLDQVDFGDGELKDPDFNVQHVIVTHSIVNCLFFHAQSHSLISGHTDGAIVVWRADDLTLKKKYTEHYNTVNEIKFDQNNSTLASASKDGTVQLWNINAEGELKPQTILYAHNEGVLTLDFHKKGIALATGGSEGSVRIWNIIDCILLIDAKLDKNSISKVFFYNQTEDILLIIRDTSEKGVYIYNEHSFEKFEIEHSSSRHMFGSKGLITDLSSDGSLIAFGMIDGAIHVYTFSNKKLYRKLKGEVQIYCFSFTLDSKKIISFGDDHVIKVWNIDAAEIIKTVATHPLRIDCMAIDSATYRFWSGGNDLKIKEWYLDLLEEQQFNAKGCKIECIALSADGCWLAVAERAVVSDSVLNIVEDLAGVKTFTNPKDVINIFDTNSGRKIFTNNSYSEVNYIRFHPCDRHLVMIRNQTFQTILLDIFLEKQVAYFGMATVSAFHPSGKYLAVNNSCDIDIWRLESLTKQSFHSKIKLGFLSEMADGSPIHKLEFSADGEYLIILAKFPATLYICKLNFINDKINFISEPSILKADIAATRIKFSTKNNYIGTFDNMKIYIWDLKTLQLFEYQHLKMDTYAMVATDFDFLSDGNNIIIGYQTGIMEIVNITRRAIIDTIESHYAAIPALKVGPSDELVTLDADNSITLWKQSRASTNAKFSWSVKWRLNPTLFVNKCNIERCSGLSPSNMKIFKASRVAEEMNDYTTLRYTLAIAFFYQDWVDIHNRKKLTAIAMPMIIKITSNLNINSIEEIISFFVLKGQNTDEILKRTIVTATILPLTLDELVARFNLVKDKKAIATLEHKEIRPSFQAASSVVDGPLKIFETLTIEFINFHLNLGFTISDLLKVVLNDEINPQLSKFLNTDSRNETIGKMCMQLMTMFTSALCFENLFQEGNFNFGNFSNMLQLG